MSVVTFQERETEKKSEFGNRRVDGRDQKSKTHLSGDDHQEENKETKGNK